MGTRFGLHENQQRKTTASASAAGTSFTPVNVTPFLWKTWNLVSNPESNDVISWSSNGKSFTVWKPDIFEEKYLPETFKHSNFSSFVRQLNNYGFRKCHSDRFEFSVKGFEKNKIELLSTVKRGNEAQKMKAKKEAKMTTTKEKDTISTDEMTTSLMKAMPTSPRQAIQDVKGTQKRIGRKKGEPTGGHTALELGAFGSLTEEVDQLKRDRMVLLKEVMRLRLQQDDTQTQVRLMEQRVLQNEQFGAQMRSLLETLQQNPKLATELGEQLNNVTSRFAPRKRRHPVPLLPDGGTADAGDAKFNGNSDSESHHTNMLVDAGPTNTNTLRLQEIIDEHEEREPSPKLFPNGNFALVPTPDNETGLSQFTWQEIMAASAPSEGNSNDSLKEMVEGMSKAEELGTDQAAFISSILERGNSGGINPTVPNNNDASDTLASTPNLDKQLSLSFLNTEEMTKLVNDMNHKLLKENDGDEEDK